MRSVGSDYEYTKYMELSTRIKRDRDRYKSRDSRSRERYRSKRSRSRSRGRQSPRHKKSKKSSRVPLVLERVHSPSPNRSKYHRRNSSSSTSSHSGKSCLLDKIWLFLGSPEIRHRHKKKKKHKDKKKKHLYDDDRRGRRSRRTPSRSSSSWSSSNSRTPSPRHQPEEPDGLNNLEVQELEKERRNLIESIQKHKVGCPSKIF